ncbi:MAG: phosphotransferase [Planctomycetota bacterium]|nr:phosphotransferase [Planctomycetota bacterium]
MQGPAADAQARLEAMTREATGATRILSREVVQSLWSGYGEILRFELEGATCSTVVVKHVKWPTERRHPRAWNSDVGHERKVNSYLVETAWYRDHAGLCGPTCRVPECLALAADGDEVFMVLEDLDAAGYGRRSSNPSPAQLEASLSWLANFHARFLGMEGKGLWPIGTYWHLSTRPEELAALEPGPLKEAAAELDRRLSESPYLTYVHGDAKLANFCFSDSGAAAAAVDFQYVGRGCGMKDLAYFVSSCFEEGECEAREQEVLARYFHHLEAALERRLPALDFAALEADWRALYPVAWTDFYRFLKGWSPSHWKIHRYSERLARQVLGRP